MEKAFRFDQIALYEVEAARTLAFVKYLPANCRHCAAFDASPLWSVITAKTGATLWSARCTEPGVKAVCKDRGLAFEEAEGTEERRLVFEVWTGAVWRRYRDLSDPDGLLRYLLEEGYAREDDPRHLVSSIDWSDPLTVAYAKHAARSPQNDWASLGAPWPLWAPCDAPSTYARLCEPRLPACVTLVDDTETSRGLGSALFRYAAPAAEAFAQGCAVSFVGDGDGDGDGGGSGGGGGGGARFTLDAHFINPAPQVPTRRLAGQQLQPGGMAKVRFTRSSPLWPPTAPEAHPLAQGYPLDPRGGPPPRVRRRRETTLVLTLRRRFHPSPLTTALDPSPRPGACTLHAITQLKPDSAAARKLRQLWQGAPTGAARAPTVGLHLRTGWADAVRHGEWRALQCAHLASQPGYERDAAVDFVVGYAPEFERGARLNLTQLLDRAAAAADGAFGARRWKLAVASDSAAVARRVAAHLGARALAVRRTAGRDGHNNAPELSTDAAAVEDVGAHAVADLVALRDSDMLLGFMSNFQKRAGQATACRDPIPDPTPTPTPTPNQAAVCPQRWFELRSITKEDEPMEHVLEMDR